MRIEYIKIPFKAPKKPDGLSPLVSRAWDYLVNCDGVCYTDRFDDDHDPIGPKLREQLMAHGAMQSTSGKTTIIFL